MDRTHRSMLVLMAAAALSLGMTACDKTPEPAPAPPAPAAPSPQAAPNPAGNPHGQNPHGPNPMGQGGPAAAPASVVWDTPNAWEKIENPSSMRIATYRIPKVEGDPEDAELSVSQAGGSVDANIDRWKGQFTNSPSEPTREQRKVGNYDVTVVEISGTFASGMPGAPAGAREKFTMLAAIIPTGDNAHFFKLTGPEKTVAAAKADFLKLVDSLRDK